MQKNEQVIETYSISDDHTTEFRMILSVMMHAMEVVPKGSDIIFLTNVSYIQQHFERQPNDKTVNAYLILKCIDMNDKHSSVMAKVVPIHKYPKLPETHVIAHEAMIIKRNKRGSDALTLSTECYLETLYLRMLKD